MNEYLLSRQQLDFGSLVFIFGAVLSGIGEAGLVMIMLDMQPFLLPEVSYGTAHLALSYLAAGNFIMFIELKRSSFHLSGS